MEPRNPELSATRTRAEGGVTRVTQLTGAMSLVTLHVYDITNTQYETANASIQGLNRFTKDILGAGGIFHGAIEVNGDEWSFGYCDRGSGVYCCRPRGNTGYTYRESAPLGVSALSPARVRNILTALQIAWQGHEYDLLARNCNHFCEAFAAQLGVGSLPAWVNRFATNADATVNAVNYASEQTQKFAEDVGNGLTNFGKGVLSLFGAGDSPPNERRRIHPNAAANHAAGQRHGDGNGAGGGGGDGDETASQSTATPPPSEGAIRS